MDRDRVKALVIEKIRDVKSSFFEDVLLQINEESLFNDLALDSLDAVELILKIENEFGIEISEEDAKGIEDNSVGDIINYIYEKVKNYDSDN